MNEVREALHKILSEDSKLSELAPGGAWFESADSDVEPDAVVIVYSQTYGKSDWAFDGEPMRPQHWDIKGIGPSKIAGQIDSRCRELLTDADLEIPDWETKYLRPEQDINYREQASGETYQHVGAIYAITIERTEG